MSDKLPDPFKPDPLANIFAVFQCEACGLMQPVNHWPNKKIFKSKCPVCGQNGVTKRLGFAMTPSQFDSLIQRTKEVGK